MKARAFLVVVVSSLVLSVSAASLADVIVSIDNLSGNGGRVSRYTDAGAFVSDFATAFSNGGGPRGVWQDPSTKKVYVADAGAKLVREYLADGTATARTFPTGTYTPSGLCVLGGLLYVNTASMTYTFDLATGPLPTAMTGAQPSEMSNPTGTTKPSSPIGAPTTCGNGTAVPLPQSSTTASRRPSASQPTSPAGPSTGTIPATAPRS